MARTKANRNNRFKHPISVGSAVLFLIGIGVGYGVKDYAEPINPSPTIADSSALVCFTPGKQCQSQLIEAINKAKKSIVVQAYSFTDKDVAQALADASKRGVNVKAILDKSNVKDGRSAKDILTENDILVRFDYPSGIAHNKVMIIDNMVVTGSYNFSTSAYKRNAENILFIKSPSLADMYMKNWLKHWEISR